MNYERLTEHKKLCGIDYIKLKDCDSYDCDSCISPCEDAKERLAELEDKIESGQAVILPCNCKIGDLVYGVEDYFIKPKPGILTSVEITKYCIRYGIVDKRLMRHDVGYVYPTAEEEAAEAKLKELRGEE